MKILVNSIASLRNWNVDEPTAFSIIDFGTRPLRKLIEAVVGDHFTCGFEDWFLAQLLSIGNLVSLRPRI
jgi:hypothetical protein